jgi:Cdc6-like AAA superfamily ATPase
MNNFDNFENVIPIIDDVIRPCYLNKIQEIILQQVWQGKTYSEIAKHYNYDAEYVKTKGCELWQLLSKSFGTKIGKNTFVPFMRSQINTIETNPKFSRQSEMTAPNETKREQIYWTTAPDVSAFRGRNKELTQLYDCIQKPCYRSIVVSGMAGCGKTTLATKFAQEVGDQFDYVIWFSLNKSFSIKALLKNYLQIFAPQGEVFSGNSSDNINVSSLLSKFLECLRTYRCLLIIDNLDSIFESNREAFSYPKNSEEYTQLLRCLVATEHQSLSLFTCNIKPKVLEYYASNRVYFMRLRGLDHASIAQIYRNRLKTNLSELEWQSLIEYCNYNPQIINIFATNINNVLEGNFDWALKELSLLQEIGHILEKELSSLSEIEKEIIYWLAINCSYPKNEIFKQRIFRFRLKSRLQESFIFLQERGLILRKDNNYILQPLIKDYIQKKLISIGLQS